MEGLPFKFTKTHVISVAGSTGNKKLWDIPVGALEEDRQILVYSPVGNPVIFINAGDTSVVATAITAGNSGDGCSVAPGSVQTFSISADNNYLAYIAATGSGTLHVTVGSGG